MVHSSDPSEAQWYACYTRARHEKKAAQVLGDRGVEYYLPTIRRERQWADRVKSVEFPLFPSYLFARVRPDEVSAVLSVPSIVEFVRRAGKPVVVTAEEIENVRRFVKLLAETGEVDHQLQPMPEKGTKIKIISGPFEGVNGVVLEHRGRQRVLVGLEAIGQGVPVDVPSASLRHRGS